MPGGEIGSRRWQPWAVKVVDTLLKGSVSVQKSAPINGISVWTTHCLISPTGELDVFLSMPATWWSQELYELLSSSISQQLRSKSSRSRSSKLLVDAFSRFCVPKAVPPKDTISISLCVTLSI